MKHKIAKLVRNRLYEQALKIYAHHHSIAKPPTNYTFPYILKACSELKSQVHGQMLHAHLMKFGHTSKHTITDLTNMYMKLGSVDSASKLFDVLPEPNDSIVHVMISGFARNGLFKESFEVFQKYGIRRVRVYPDRVASVLPACGNMAECAQVHCFAAKAGVEFNDYVVTSLITMYLSFGNVADSGRLFNLVKKKSLLCFNAYISGLAQNGVVETVLCAFKDVMRGKLCKETNKVTVIALISACSNGKCVSFGRQVHGFMVKFMMEGDGNVETALMDLYSKCGSWECAYQLFKEMGSRRSLVTWNSMIAGMMLNDQSEHAIELFVELENEIGIETDSVTWNSMISGFSKLGKVYEAFVFFEKMISVGFTPSANCITSLLDTCSSISALRVGKQIHAYALRAKMIDDAFLATAIIDMYMKCGLPSWAHIVFNQFDEVPSDPAFWNAMISGYGKNGMCEAAFDVFDQMIDRKLRPNLVTLSCLLSVCSQTGEVEKGFEIFRVMIVDYGLKPTLKHMNILIDLLCRSGKLDEALELLQATHEKSAAVFASLLGASEHYSDPKLGEEMHLRLSEIEPENPIPFIILSNIYAGQEKWKDVHKIRSLMNQKGLKKIPGLSSIA